MKMKSTKTALLMSFTSLLLCAAMLIGTTFAWFTDSVTSGVNKIQAGNLDIEVSYFDKTVGTSGEWVSIEGKDSLFDKNALWEPGHTEYVTLKIENKGNLALKYQMKVSPVSESGGINVYGEEFKLSNYLKFGTTEPVDSDPSYVDRADARAAVTTAVGLAQAGLGQTGEMTTQGETEYITLVVYMPEDVDNHANYKTGTAAPFINLGITVLATQKTAESDSFGTDYDTAASNDTTVVYNYFPLVTQVAQLEKGEGSKAKPGGDNDPQVKENGDKITITSAAKVGEGTDAPVAASVTFGNDAVNFGSGDTATVTLDVKKVNAPTANITVTDTQEAVAFDVKVTITGADFAKSGDNFASPMEVTMFIGKGKTNLKLYHGNAMMKTTGDNDYAAGAADTFTYDSATGVVTMYVDHFSEFTAVYDEPVAAIGTTAYYSLESAVAAAKSGDTITLLKDCKGNGISVPSGKNFTVDFNGFTYDVNGELAGSAGTKSQAFQLLKDSTITFKNGKLTSSVAKMMIQNYSNLTLTNMTIDGTGLQEGNLKYVVSNNYGTVVINGNTSILAKEDWFALDSCGAEGSWSGNTYAPGADVTVDTTGVIDGKVESCSKLVIKNGTFKGTIAKATCLSSVPDTAVSITGGTFSVKPEDTYLAADHFAVENNGVWNVVYQEPKEISITDTEGTTEMSFDSFRTNVNGGNTYANATVKLMKNITIDDGMPVVGQFAGTFDGDNKTITMAAQICMNDMSKGYCFEDGKKYAFGIFDRVSGTIKNVNVVYSDTTPVAVSTHYTYLGGIVGFLEGGTIDNCTVSGTIRNYNRIGGFVGAGYTGNVKNCVMTANITDLNYDAYTYQLAGGIVGFLGKSQKIDFTIEGCTVKDCYLGFELSSGEPEKCDGYAASGILGWAETDKDVPSSSLAIKNCTLTNVKGYGKGYGNQVGVYYCGGTSTLTLTGLTINDVSIPDDSYTYSSGEGGSLWTSPSADGSFGTTRLMQITAGCQPNHSAAN